MSTINTGHDNQLPSLSSLAWRKVEYFEGLRAAVERGFRRQEALLMSDHAAWNTETYWEQLTAAREEYQLELSFHLPIYELDVSSPEANAWAESWTIVEEMARRAQALGVTIMVCHPEGPPALERPHPDRWDRLERGLRRIVPLLEETQTTLAMENMSPGYMSGDLGHLVEVVAAVNAPRIRMCLDVGHAHLCRRPAEEIQRALPWLVAIHVHDNYGQDDDHLMPGDGNVDWTMYRRLLREGRFQGRETWELYLHRGELRDLLHETQQRYGKWGPMSPPPAK